MEMTNFKGKQKHNLLLKQSYEEVGIRTWLKSDFQLEQLETSRNLFENHSLSIKTPVPRTLSVFALLSGQPFEKNVTDILTQAQEGISDILGDKCHYFVKPNNFGIEYCVFKWPDGPWKASWHEKIKNTIKKIPEKSFQLEINGLQINPDGCLLVKGFDENKSLFKIREYFQKSLPFLPTKQSNWAHIPIGRILEPVGLKKFKKLKAFSLNSEKTLNCKFLIDKLQYVHETRWYMEERTTLSSHQLGSQNAKLEQTQ